MFKSVVLHWCVITMIIHDMTYTQTDKANYSLGCETLLGWCSAGFHYVPLVYTIQYTYYCGILETYSYLAI